MPVKDYHTGACLGGMTEAAGPGDAFAIGDDTQYQPVAATGNCRIPVSGPEGTGLLASHASGPLAQAAAGAGSDRGARRCATRTGTWRARGTRRGWPPRMRSWLAAQFLADVDRAGVDRVGVDGPDGALYWRVEGWKGGYPALRPPLSWSGVPG